MPIYEYRCTACGAQFDKFFRSMNKIPAEINCPSCESVEVQRLVSKAAVHGEGGSVGGDEIAAAAEAAAPQKQPFGRKELKQAEEAKRQIKEQVKYGDA